MTTHRVRLAAVGLFVSCVSPLLLAQPERISLGVVPRAGQTVHHRITQGVAMEMVPDGDSHLPIPALKMDSTTTIALTEVAGTADEQGRFKVNVTYDDFTADVTMNGRRAPVPGMNPLAGKTFVATYEADGAVVDVTGPPGTEEMVVVIRQMVQQMSAQLPRTALAVGETATVPVSVQLPVPATRGMNITGESTTKLVSIDSDGADRIASCESVLHANMANTLQIPGQGAGALTLDLTMSGTGKLQINVSRHVVTLNESTTTVDGTLSMTTREGQAPERMNVHGLVKMALVETR